MPVVPTVNLQPFVAVERERTVLACCRTSFACFAYFIASKPRGSHYGFTKTRSEKPKFFIALAVAPMFSSYSGSTRITRKRSGFCFAISCLYQIYFLEKERIFCQYLRCAHVRLQQLKGFFHAIVQRGCYYCHFPSFREML